MPCRTSRRSCSQEQQADEEKQQQQQTPRKPWSVLDTSAIIVRLFQWLSSVFVYASFAYLFHYISQRGIGEGRRLLDAIRLLGSGTLAYHTFLLGLLCLLRFGRLSAAWRFFAIATVLGDLMMMGLAISKITVLSIAGVPASCSGLTRANYLTNNGIRGEVTRDTTDDLSFVCGLPKTVYGLCVLAIFSHTLSIVLTVSQLQKNWRSITSTTADGRPQGHVEEAVPSAAAMAQHDRQYTPSPRSSMQFHHYHYQQQQQQRRRRYQQEQRTWLTPTTTSTAAPAPGPIHPVPRPRSTPPPPTTTTPPNQDPKYANMPADLRFLASVGSSNNSNGSSSGIGSSSSSTTLVSRPSTESTRSVISSSSSSPGSSSSFNPDIYLVTDGFHVPGEDPPEYTSRPSSLYDACPSSAVPY